MSDLHLEMERWRLAVPGWAAFMARHRSMHHHPPRGPLLDDAGPVDLVVLAGDIHNGLRGIIYADQIAAYLNAPAVMIAGNHEYYHHDADILLPALRNATAKTQGRVSFLENTVASYEIRGRRLNVLGCTLWTDYELHGTPALSMQAAQNRMNDYVFITLNEDNFSAEAARAWHLQSRLWLHETLAQLCTTDPDATNLIVTHHAPSGAVLGSRQGNIAPAYGSALMAEFAQWRPAAWIHGHTHHRHETVEEGIPLVSAPRGYVAYDGEEALKYRPGYLVI